MVNTNQTNTAVKFGDTFYLRNKSGQYLIAADKGRYFFPQLDNKDGERLQIVGDTKELQHNDEIKIRSLETRLGDKPKGMTSLRDILGAFPDSHNCYYWNNGYDDRKQKWKITKASGKLGIIHYGEDVVLTNVYYDKQTLAADTKHPGYLTTDKHRKEVWILESTEKITAANSITSKPKTVFDLSVASGDPTPTGVVLWTRINPESESYRDDIPVQYQVALSRDFNEPLIEGTVAASDINEKTDYTVKVKLDKLKSDKRYFYRFIYGAETSPIGRCKTLPTKHAELKNLSLAIITCNDYSSGYFNAFYHLAEEDIDFVVHLGDFVYEYPQYPSDYGEILRTDLKLTDKRYKTKYPNENVDRTILLADFRRVYQTYRRDPALQKAMENHTWIITLDDHEIADNCYWDYANDTMSVSVDKPLHPIQENLGKDSQEAKDAMKQLYEDAIQAWSEYVPANFQKTGKPPYKLYRSFCFGSLMDFYLTDSRSFRDKPDLEINQQILAKVKEHQASNPDLKISDTMAAVRREMNLHDWQASMLGKDQREWLIEGVIKSNADWKVWGNQTLLATSTMNETIGEIDDWHGFKAERYEILQAVKERETDIRGSDKSRFVVFTGDMHTSLIAYLKTETDSWASDLATSATLSNFGSAIKNAGKGLWSGVTLDLPSAANNLGEGAKNLAAGGINAVENLGSGIMNPLETSQKIVEDGVNNLNYDYSKLAGVEFMTPGLTSPGLSEYIYVSAGNKAGDLEKELGINLAPVTETVGAAASSIFESASSLLSSVVPDVIEDAVETVEDKVSAHKLATANVIKRFSPHIEHFDSSVNGYAIAEFTKEKMRWYVYAIDKTIYDKTDGGRNLSTNRAEKKLVQSATYDPDGISLDD